MCYVVIDRHALQVDAPPGGCYNGRAAAPCTIVGVSRADASEESNAEVKG
jgi:hypothetical protein